MITEDYVSFETAKLLKEKGFDEECREFWKEWDGEIMLCPCCSSHVFEFCHNSMLEEYNDDEELNIAAPTLQMVMKWLRFHNWSIAIEPKTFLANMVVDSWSYKIWADTELEVNMTESFKTYEEACESAIKYCLKNLI